MDRRTEEQLENIMHLTTAVADAEAKKAVPFLLPGGQQRAK